MKYLKKFESFVTDDNRGEDTQFPQHNAALRTEVTEYVDTILNSNEYHELVEILGMELPKNVSGEEIDEFFDKVREKAIKHFIENPEQVQEIGFKIQSYQVPGNDGVPRTNKVGGVMPMSESIKPQRGSHECDVIEVTDDELAYFEDEAPLLDLVRDEKVTLYDNQIWYNKNDKETIDVLDVYFEL